MESITKNRQPPEVLRAMVARAYGADQVVDGDDFATELGHGWFNVAYRIRLADGREVVLKVAPPPHVRVMTYERDLMANEVAALGLVRARTGVPVPVVDHYDTARDLCDAEWFFIPFVDAENFGVIDKTDALTPVQVDAYNRLLGAANAELNTIRTS